MQTFNNCYYSPLTVHPKNWQDKGASTLEDWYINYRFYDPLFKDAKGKIKPKQVRIKKLINDSDNVKERRKAVSMVLQGEIDMLNNDGWNPITKKFMVEVAPDLDYEIEPDTPFIKALKKSLARLDVVKDVRKDITGIIEKLNTAAQQLRIDQKGIATITKRNIKYLLEQCGKNSETFSNNRYNTYRGYLMMLFKELTELEATPVNIIRDISKKRTTKKIKKVLTIEEREKMDKYLGKHFPRFRMFIHLFFHSGGRKTELFQLKPGSVNLKTQKYKCVIKKRKNYEEVERTIKDIALPYWEFFLKDCPEDHFLFGTLFKPGLKPMGNEMPTQYWKRFVKEDLKIEADLYALKHLNTTETVDRLSEADAASQNGQQGTGMVVKIYDVGQKDRQHKRLKGVDNPLVAGK